MKTILNYSASAATIYLNAQINALAAAGIPVDEAFINSRLMTAIKEGNARISLDVAEQICVALNIEPRLMLGAVLKEHWPELFGPLARSRIIEAVSAATETDQTSPKSTLRVSPTLDEDRVPSDAEPTGSAEGCQSCVDLNFKVTPTFHMQFKLEATRRRISMKQLLETAFDFYVLHNSRVE